MPLSQLFTSATAAEGYTPFHVAAAWARLPALAALTVARPSGLEDKTEAQESTVHLAVRCDRAPHSSNVHRMPIIRWLLHRPEHLRLFSQQQGGHHTPVHVAVENHDLALVRLLLRRIPSAFDIPDLMGRTAVHAGVASRTADMVGLLLEHHRGGFDVRHPQEDTPVHFAVRLGCVPVVRLLLERYPEGFDVVGRHGETPLQFAASVRNTKMVQLIQSRTTGTI